MRSPLIATAAAALVLSTHALASAGAADNPHTITLLLQIDDVAQSSAESIAVMKQELADLLNTRRVRFEFRSVEEAQPPAQFRTLVSVRMCGVCSVAERFALTPPGPLAFTHSTDGEILPFVEVECDRVRNSVRSALWGLDRNRERHLYGRALARVLAHELYHVVTKSRHHTRKGITSPALSGHQLISEDFGLEHDTAGFIDVAIGQ